MQTPDHSVAKTQVGRAMLEGCSWREAVRAAGRQMSRATAYRLRQRMLAHGEGALGERRQGHASKVRGAIRTWLDGYYQQHPRAPGRAVQALLEARCGVRVSVTHLNRVRAVLTRATCRGEKSARDLAGWVRWSPVVGRSPGDASPPGAGDGLANEGGSVHTSSTGASHRPHTTVLPADPTVSGGCWFAPPVGFTRLCPGGVGAAHHPAPGIWVLHRRAVSLAGGAGGRP